VSGTVRWEGRTLYFEPDAPLEPDTLYGALLSTDLKGKQGRPLLSAVSWQFSTDRPRILYVSSGEEGHFQLFTIPLEGGEPFQITREPFGVWDFALSPDGTTIVYAASQEDERNELWTIRRDGSERRRLLDCGGDDCTGAIWTPDGRRLVYERRNPVLDSSFLVPSRLWWLDPASGESLPVFQDEQKLGHSARISADGEWLSYISPLEEGMHLYQVVEGVQRVIPGEMQGPAAWAPEEDTLLVSYTRFVGTGFGASLIKANLGTNQYTELNDDPDVSATSPAWSPDGDSIVFRRSTPTGPGSQLWLMSSDGSRAQALTDDLEYESASPSWSPDGRYVVFQRFSLQEPYAEPEVWVIDISSKRSRRVIEPGAWPVWLP
jgi:Tol biopolymer transport system component